MKTIIFGGGNMGGAIAKGLSNGKIVDVSQITVVDPSTKALEAISAFDDRIKTVKSDDKALSEANIIIIALKPWLVEGFLNGIKHKIDYNKQIIVSIAAGISIEQLNQSLKKEGHQNPAIFKVIPNTAVEVNESITFITSNNASPEQEKLLSDIFNDMGKVMLIQEDYLPAATTLGSCGIAFIFRYIRAAMSAGTESGFSPEQSKEIILQTMKGAIEILSAKNTHPEEEIDRVTTPGGITIKGLNALEEFGFTNAIIQGIRACNDSRK